MGMDLARKDFSTAPDYFIAGTNIGITTAVKEAGVNLPAHTPVLLSAGKVTPVAAGAEGKAPATTGIYGITADSANTGEDAVIYLTGEFFAKGLVLPEGVTVADVEIALRDIGIFLK